MIFTVNLDGHYTYVNEALARFLGESAQMLVGRYRYAFVANSPTHQSMQELADKLAAGEEIPPQVYEVASVHGPRWVESVFSALRTPDGRVVRIRGCARDVHARHIAEEELRASLEELRKSEEELRRLIQELPPIAPAADTTDIIGFDPHGPGSEERASISVLRKPLAALNDEEVHGLKEELDRLRREVKREKAAIERRAAAIAAEDPMQNPGGNPAAPAARTSFGGPMDYPPRFRGRKRKPPTND
jgi:PAS domain S-box-containing protein